MKTQKFYNSIIRDNEASENNSIIRKFGTMKTQKKIENSKIRDNEDSEKQFDNSIIRDNEDSEK